MLMSGPVFLLEGKAGTIRDVRETEAPRRPEGFESEVNVTGKGRERA